MEDSVHAAANRRQRSLHQRASARNNNNSNNSTCVKYDTMSDTVNLVVARQPPSGRQISRDYTKTL